MLRTKVRNILDTVSSIIDRNGNTNDTILTSVEMGDDDTKLIASLIWRAFTILRSNGVEIHEEQIEKRSEANVQTFKNLVQEKPILGEGVDNFHASMSYDLLVYCAECSLKCNFNDVCLQCLNYFFSTCSCKTDNIYVRAQFCQARLEGKLALALKGEV